MVGVTAGGLNWVPCGADINYGDAFVPARYHAKHVWRGPVLSAARVDCQLGLGLATGWNGVTASHSVATGYFDRNGCYP